jgi:uncharacterized membrane protein
MSEIVDFLTQSEEKEVVEAIKIAEKNTSGEIRVHIEKHTDKKHYDRALEVFQNLKMNETQQRNGVLIYVAIDDKSFAICGDKGINDIVGNSFWNSTKDLMQEHFKQGNFKQGLVEGITKAGNQLKKHFPYQIDDVDELSNEISKG